MVQQRKEELKNGVLGKKIEQFKFTEPTPKLLETFSNKFSKRDYLIELTIPEFTNICPLTIQPDFAKIVIRYIPDAKCIESKSLKLYIFSYRNFPEFHEDVVNRILEDCVEACGPRWMLVRGEFNARGGISITPSTQYTKPNFLLPAIFQFRAMDSATS